MALRKINMGYKLGKNAPSLNNLFFMDYLKVYGKSEKEIDSLVKTVKMCCKDIGMEFGVSKCATLVMKRGKRAHSDGIVCRMKNAFWKPMTVATST